VNFAEMLSEVLQIREKINSCSRSNKKEMHNKWIWEGYSYHWLLEARQTCHRVRTKVITGSAVWIRRTIVQYTEDVGDRHQGRAARNLRY